ncbi:hypothetical protein [Aeromonas phage AerS_266]|nr:hypothetical protein [Aeromonas phage AerS_266]
MSNKELIFRDPATVVSVYPKYAIINCKTSKTHGLKVFPKELVDLLKNWDWMEIRVMKSTTIFFFTDNKLALTPRHSDQFPRFDLSRLHGNHKLWYSYITNNEILVNKNYGFDAVMKMVGIIRPDLKNDDQVIKTLLEFKR